MKYLKNLCYIVCCTIAVTACIDDKDAENLRIPINFSAIDVTTRADGEITATTLSSINIFAYASGTEDYNETTTKLNYIYNVEIAKTDAVWTPTTPVYWPLDPAEKLTFFAYATNSTTIATANNTLSLPAFNSAGHPALTYTNTHPDIDFLLAIPQANRTKTSGTISFSMQHAMTKLIIRVQNVGSNAIKVTGLTLKTKKQGTFVCPPSTSMIACTSTGTAEEDYITHDEGNLDISLDGGNAAYQDIKTYYLLPDREGTVLTLTYTKYSSSTIGNGETGTTHTATIYDTPPSEGDIAFDKDVPWLPGLAITYSLQITD